MNTLKKRYIVFIILSLILHYVLVTLVPDWSVINFEATEDEKLLVFLEPIESGKITFTNQKINNEKPDHAQFLAEHDNRTEREVKNLKEFTPVELRNPIITDEIKLEDEGEDEIKTALRDEQIEFPSLEDYLENFRDQDNIEVSDYVDINTYSFKYISYFKRLKQRIEFVLNLPYEAYVAGLYGTGVVGFTIAKDGALEHFEILESTGYRILDRSMVEALKKAAPYEPLPDSMGLSELKIKSFFSFTTQYSHR